jgi:hypothetical protein
MRTPTSSRILATLTTLIPLPAHAAVFDGGGIQEGVGIAGTIAGLLQGDARTTTTNILITVLSYMALASVVTIVAAGIYMIIGFGSDDNKDKAKNIVIYTLIGLIIILFARVLVGVFTIELPSRL